MSLNELPQPVIAKVQGVATAAGCQLVASCDLAMGSTDASFGVSGINVGLCVHYHRFLLPIITTFVDDQRLPSPSLTDLVAFAQHQQWHYLGAFNQNMHFKCC
jgi:hypothetical protein